MHEEEIFGLPRARRLRDSELSARAVAPDGVERSINLPVCCTPIDALHEDCAAFCSKHSEAMRTVLHEHGGLLLRGWPNQGPAAFSAAVRGVIGDEDFHPLDHSFLRIAARP